MAQRVAIARLKGLKGRPYLDARLGVSGGPAVPQLPDLIRSRGDCGPGYAPQAFLPSRLERQGSVPPTVLRPTRKTAIHLVVGT